jgi:hypothetical protein
MSRPNDTAATAPQPDAREVTRLSSIQDATVKRWQGWDWKAYQSAIVRQNYKLGDAEALAAALRVLEDHARETYPHFESERGQRDISAARAALAAWDKAK